MGFLSNLFSRKKKEQVALTNAKIAYYKKALDLQPKSQLRLRNLGIACREAGRWEEAIVYLKEAIAYATEPLDEASIEDFKASIKDRIAICYFNIGKYAEAVQYWEEALAEKNWSPNQRSAILSDLRKAQAKLQS